MKRLISICLCLGILAVVPSSFAAVYQIDAHAISPTINGDFSITFNDSSPNDGILTIGEIVSFSGVSFWSGGWGPYEEVIQTPGYQFSSSLSIQYSGNWYSGQENWIFMDPDNSYPVMSVSAYAYTYNVADSSNTSPVPIPGAIWLLGSGIIGLAGVRLKRKHN